MSEYRPTVKNVVTAAYHHGRSGVHPYGAISAPQSHLGGGRLFMQRTILRLGVAMLAVAGLVFASLPASAAGITTTIPGVVTDVGTGAPIANVCVWYGPVHIVRSQSNTNCVFTNGAGVFTHDFIKGSFTIPLTYELDPAYAQA